MKPVALVTGGSRGIGAAIVRSLAARGMAVACTATSLDNAARLASDVNADYPDAVLPLQMLVERPDQVERAFKEAQDVLGPVTLTVNNAGVVDVAPIVDADAEAISKLIDVNLKGVLYCAQAAARVMVGASVSGSIINIGSVAGMNGFPNRSAYASSKAAVHHLTKILAIELAQHEIRVNCVVPGFVETDMIKDIAAKGWFDVESLMQRTPLGRLVPAEDIAEAVVWLSSPAARNITGESLLIDGGWTAYGHL